MPKTNPKAQFESWSLKMPRAELGGLLKEYLAESNHSNWEGFTKQDLTGINKFLVDLMTYHKAADDPKHFATETSNVNPVP